MHIHHNGLPGPVNNQGHLQHWHRQRNLLTRQLEENIQALPGDSPGGAVAARRITDLCQSLVDYLCLGHFMVYIRLLNEAGQCPDNRLEAARAIMQHLERSTDHALHFNDKYDTDADSLAGESTLTGDLVLLVGILRVRFVLEDRLVELLQNRPGDRMA